MYVPITIFLIVFGFVIVGLFYLLCFLPREVPLAFFFFKEFLYFYYLFIYLFIYLFLSVLGPCFCARTFSSRGKRGHSSSRCTGPSLTQPLLLWSTGSRRAGSVVVAHGPSCSAACGILPDQGSNPRPLHWQADSQPLRHQGSPSICFKAGLVVLYHEKLRESLNFCLSVKVLISLSRF